MPATTMVEIFKIDRRGYVDRDPSRRRIITMIEILNKILDGFISALKGLLIFFAEVTPVLFKLLFVSSPFFLAIFTAYFIGGIYLASIVAAIVGIFIFIGWLRAVRKENKDSKLTKEVIVIVSVSDLLMIALIVILYWTQLKKLLS